MSKGDPGGGHGRIKVLGLFYKGAHGEMGNPDQLRRYLLGDLSESEQEWVERECVADETMREALQTAENDLIDAWVCLELSAAERLHFERVFLDSFERRRRVEIAQLLMNSDVRAKAPVDPALARPAPSWWRSFFPQSSIRTALAGAVIVMIVVTVFVVLRDRQLRTELGRSQSTRLELQNQIDDMRRQTAQNQFAVDPRIGPSTTPSPAIASLTLSSGLLRSSGGSPDRILKLSPAVSSAVLTLTAEPASETSTPAATKYSDYDVVLQTVEGRTVKTLHGLAGKSASAGGMIIRASFPAQLMKEGDYIVTLWGRTVTGERGQIDSYAFSVIAEPDLKK